MVYGVTDFYNGQVQNLASMRAHILWKMVIKRYLSSETGISPCNFFCYLSWWLFWKPFLHNSCSLGMFNYFLCQKEALESSTPLFYCELVKKRQLSIKQVFTYLQNSVLAFCLFRGWTECLDVCFLMTTLSFSLFNKEHLWLRGPMPPFFYHKPLNWYWAQLENFKILMLLFCCLRKVNKYPLLFNWN